MICGLFCSKFVKIQKNMFCRLFAQILLKCLKNMFLYVVCSNCVKIFKTQWICRLHVQIQQTCLHILFARPEIKHLCSDFGDERGRARFPGYSARNTLIEDWPEGVSLLEPTPAADAAHALAYREGKGVFKGWSFRFRLVPLRFASFRFVRCLCASLVSPRFVSSRLVGFVLSVVCLVGCSLSVCPLTPFLPVARPCLPPPRVVYSVLYIAWFSKLPSLSQFLSGWI